MRRSRLIPMILTAFALAGFTLLPGCGTTSDDDDSTSSGTGEPATVQEICSKVFDCFDNNWGWDSEESCQELWLTDCADTDAYLVCVADCLSGDCSGFALEDGTGGCEPDCWNSSCN